MQRAAKLADEYADAMGFFTPENLALLENWGGDHRNPRSFSIRPFGSRRTFQLPDKSQATLHTIWPTPPSLSVLRGIVGAGIEHDGVLKQHKL